MNTVSYIINGVLALAIAVLFYFQFAPNSKSKSNSTQKVNTTSKDIQNYSGVIAYVNIDTLEDKYLFFKDKKAELEQRQKSIESSLMKDAEILEREVYELQQKAPTLTQAEGESIQERLMKKQYNLEKKKNDLAESFLNEQIKFNIELNAKLDSFLTEFNKDKNYAYILSYTKGGQVLFKDESLDITQEVIDGMNAQLTKK
jgi:outer membrane protein